MSAITATEVSSGGRYGAAFWERLWRTAGLQFVGLCIIAYLVYGNQPQVGASPDTLAAFYSGGRTRILIAASISGLAVLYLMWFAAAVRATLADAGEDGWGSALTGASAAVGAVFLLIIAVVAALAYSIAGSRNDALLSGLNDFTWAAVVMSSFVRAMVVMAPTFGLWRAGVMSNRVFAIGVTIVVLSVLGGTTWVSGGFWAPDGVFSRYISPILGLLWAVVVSDYVLKRPLVRRFW